MQSPGHQLKIGDVLGTRYRILSILGQGGMGTVYLAEDVKLLGKRWAVKETFHTEDNRRKFIEEAEMLSKLSHPHLPGIVDYFPPDEKGFGYLVMDYIQGQTLQEMFMQRSRRMDAAQVVKYALQVCDLFHYLHHELPTSVIYRDLKPSNIMIEGSDTVRLIDFGIARDFKESNLTDTVQIGTVGFAAPEQFENHQTDNRTDLYALGAVIYYLLSEGRYYYVTQVPLIEINREIPDRLSYILEKMLKNDPDERYQTAKEAKEDLTRFLYKLSDGDSLPGQSEPNNMLGPVIIAVAGTFNGAGSTHTALMIANHLAGQGKQVACIEANDSNQFEGIEAAYEGVREYISTRKHFSIGRVEYYKTGSSINMVTMLSAGYPYVILDIGYYDESPWFGEFLRANIQIVVTSGSEWRQKDLARFCRNHEHLDQSRWLYCIPFAGRRVFDDLRKEYPGRKFHALPVHSDPFMEMKETDEAMEILLGLGVKKDSGKKNAGKWLSLFK
jgi:serine/threonine-protein kinase